MSNIIPFQFDSNEIRVVTTDDGETLFVARDVAAALGYSDAAQAVRMHCKHAKSLNAMGALNQRSIETIHVDMRAKLIPEADVYRLVSKSQLPSAERFEAWVFEEVLPTLRKTGRYEMPQAAPTSVPASKEFHALFRTAKLLGLNKNEAAIAANQGTLKLTGVNMLQLLDKTHLESEVQETLLTQTEVAQRLGVNVRIAGKQMVEAGLWTEYRDHKDRLCHELTEEGKRYGKYQDTGRTHNSGTPVTQIKWYATVVDHLKEVVPLSPVH